MDLAVTTPPPRSDRIAVHVKADVARHLRKGHPWVWDGSVERVSKPGTAGDLAVVFDEQRRFVGIGLFDPTSPIRVRVLHAGSPQTVDADFFADKVVSCVERRDPLIADPATTAYRLIHGENDRLGGIVVDRYANTLVVRLDTPAWVPHLPAVLTPLADLVEVDRVVLRCSRRITGLLPTGFSDGMTIFGSSPDGPIPFLEHGLWFEADVVHGQKTGHFLDQRENRRLAATRALDADVLDVFCHTGGFSVHAAAADARRVHSVDASPHAIASTREHVEQNRTRFGFDAIHTTDTSDAFEALESLVDRRERFDLVIVDPPSFAPNQRSVGAARRSYRRLTSLALDLLGTGGTLFQASCSSRIDDVEFHDLIADELEARNWKATNVVRTTHCIDHPIGFAEGSYLKALLADVTPR